MGFLDRYPRYAKRKQLKTTAAGADPGYLRVVHDRLRAEWSTRRETIAESLVTEQTSRFQHWVQALVEATYDLENGMSLGEVDLPLLEALLQDHGPSPRDLYTGLFVISCWENGLTAGASSRQLEIEAKQAGITTRALHELLKKVEPVRRALSETSPGPPPILGEAPPPSHRERHAVEIVVEMPRFADSRAALVEVLRSRFRQAEREALIHRLGASPEDVKLNPLTREDFAWAMVIYMEQRGCLALLWDAVDQARPGALSGPHPFR